MNRQDNRTLFLSAVSIGELRRGFGIVAFDALPAAVNGPKETSFLLEMPGDDFLSNLIRG